MGKREILAAQKRREVTSSSDYKAWVYYRRQAPNPPSDYYHAYMTDKALRAPQEDRTPWSKHPYEADWGRVDSPTGHHEPRHTSKPVQSQPNKTEVPKVKQDIKDEIKELGRTMSKDFDSPNVDQHTFLDASSRRSQMALTRNRLTGQYVASEARIGLNSSRPAIIAAAAHEFGHHIHARGKDRNKLADIGVPSEPYRASSSYNKSSLQLKKQYGNETAAWKIAQPYIDKTLPKKGGQLAMAKWGKAYALTTYRREQTRDMIDPRNYTIHFGKKRF
jgi:hypothetical protein